MEAHGVVKTGLPRGLRRKICPPQNPYLVDALGEVGKYSTPSVL